MPNDIAIVAVSQTPSYRRYRRQRAVACSWTRQRTSCWPRPASIATTIDFTIAGSCDYLSGMPFAFVSEHRRRRRLAAGLRDRTSRWTARGRCSRPGCGCSSATSTSRSSRLGQVVAGHAARDLPAADRPLLRRRRSASTPCRWPASRRARCSTRARRPSATSPRSCRAAGATALRNPNAQVTNDVSVDELLKEPYYAAPLRKHDLPPISDGAAAVLHRARRAGARAQRAIRSGSAASTTASSRTTPACAISPTRRRPRTAAAKLGARRRPDRRRRADACTTAPRRSCCARRSVSARARQRQPVGRAAVRSSR